MATEPNAPDDDVLRQARAWAVLLKTGQPTTRDLESLKAWCAQSAGHARAWSQAAHEWQAVETAARRVPQARPARKVHGFAGARAGRRAFLGGAVAAGAAYLAVSPPWGLWPSWSEFRADYRTGAGEQRSLELRGQVRVTLNTRTSITVNDAAARPRIDLISGEAAVSAPACEIVAGVASVRLDHADIEMRQLEDGRVRVRCQRGAAELRHPAGRVALAAQQEALYDERRVGPATPLAKAASASAWREGVVVFDDLPLDQAVQEINRYRPGRVVLVDDALADRRFSARVRVSDLDQALELLRTAHHIRLRRVGELVLIG